MSHSLVILEAERRNNKDLLMKRYLGFQSIVSLIDSVRWIPCVPLLNRTIKCIRNSCPRLLTIYQAQFPTISQWIMNQIIFDAWTLLFTHEAQPIFHHKFKANTINLKISSKITFLCDSYANVCRCKSTIVEHFFLLIGFFEWTMGFVFFVGRCKSIANSHI